MMLISVRVKLLFLKFLVVFVFIVDGNCFGYPRLPTANSILPTETHGNPFLPLFLLVLILIHSFEIISTLSTTYSARLNKPYATDIFCILKMFL